MKLWRRVKDIVVEKILGLHDTPERIAWGVAIGFFVACTPTMGLQLPIYVALAVLLRANKVSGIVPTWLVNPVTMVPFYWGCWRVGAFLLGRSDVEGGRGRIEEIANAEWSWRHVGDLAEALWSLGAELWLGGAVVGVISAAIAYPLTLRAVRAYRRRRSRLESPAPPGSLPEARGSDDGVGIGEGAQP